MTNTTHAPDSLWQQIRDHLEHKRRPLYEEIKHYPRPIRSKDNYVRLTETVSFRSLLANVLAESAKQLSPA